MGPRIRTSDLRIRIHPVKGYFAYHFLKVHLQSKKSQNSRNKGFSYFFTLVLEGSGSGSVQVIANPGPGGPKIYGSHGSGSTTLEEIISVKKDTSQTNSG